MSFVLPLLSGMVGDLLTSLSPVPVASHSLLTIHFTVPLVVFPLLDTMELCNVTANLLPQVCSNVQNESHLQLLPGETLPNCTSNADDQARA